MKKILLISTLAFLFCINHAFAQDPFEVQSRVYKTALKNYDLQAASIALYNMIALKPERTDLQDSLVRVYFAGEKYYQAYMIGEEIVKANPEKTDILELVAVAKQSLGMVKEALADYEKLYEAQKTLYNLYQVATLQYQLKRYGECVLSVDEIIKDPKSIDEKVNISLQKGGSQAVPLKAAALNVKGICALEMKQEEVAKDCFTKALEIFPDFLLAKGNLELVSKPAPAAKTPVPVTKAPTPAPKTPAPAKVVPKTGGQ